MSITAADVKRLRERTGLPMMDCKSALNEAGGDEEQAIELLRKRGQKILSSRSDRETAFGRFGLYCGTNLPCGAIVELKCESAPVTTNEEFIKLANDLAKQLAVGPGAATADELLDQASPSNPNVTLREQMNELFNRIREVFNVGRMKRVEGGTGGYIHNSTTVSGVLIGVEGGSDDAARAVSMHIAAMRPQSLSVADLDPAIVAKERSILREAALAEGKPENIVDKMVEGRLKNFYAESVLLEQPFVRDDKQTVGEFAKANGMAVKQYIHWELGVE
ncbi:MAG TPA: translation elongation factor Ts [Pirellulaceae bacterium]|nr:translation elongation factor Ts [Pirellulaceae bacterium]HMO91516.1 translation elongation factor Ts [Pirellulaceae bacterium]HMP71376.1 translation elongation factor Ts [Pirellulaceae bacterium]